jgi:ADP-ribosylglycohydrolase
MAASLDQFAGCLLGLAMGDALGAPHEGGPLERLVWRFIGRTRNGELRFTDDTQMTLDLGESLLAAGGVSQVDLATRFAAGYRWSRGYGPGTARVLKRIRRGQSWQIASKTTYAGGSYGNGAAMRAPVLGLFFAREEDALAIAAQQTAEVTHAHPQAVAGAMLMAMATHMTLERKEPVYVVETLAGNCVEPPLVERLQLISSWLQANSRPEPREVAARLGNGVAAVLSCPTALYIALRHRNAPFEELMQFAIRCRGDVDTIAAMAGALWGAGNGIQRLPAAQIEGREMLENLAARLWNRRPTRYPMAQSS